MKTTFIPYASHLTSLKRLIKYFPNLQEFETSISLAMSGDNLKQALATLSNAEHIKILKLGFQACSQLKSHSVKKRFVDALCQEMPTFKSKSRPFNFQYFNFWRA
jgi:hypothetical protein